MPEIKMLGVTTPQSASAIVAKNHYATYAAATKLRDRIVDTVSAITGRGQIASIIGNAIAFTGGLVPMAFARFTSFLAGGNSGLENTAAKAVDAFKTAHVVQRDNDNKRTKARSAKLSLGYKAGESAVPGRAAATPGEISISWGGLWSLLRGTKTIDNVSLRESEETAERNRDNALKELAREIGKQLRLVETIVDKKGASKDAPAIGGCFSLAKEFVEDIEKTLKSNTSLGTLSGTQREHFIALLKEELYKEILTVMIERSESAVQKQAEPKTMSKLIKKISRECLDKFAIEKPVDLIKEDIKELAKKVLSEEKRNQMTKALKKRKEDLRSNNADGKKEVQTALNASNLERKKSNADLNKKLKALEKDYTKQEMHRIKIAEAGAVIRGTKRKEFVTEDAADLAGRSIKVTKERVIPFGVRDRAVELSNMSTEQIDKEVQKWETQLQKEKNDWVEGRVNQAIEKVEDSLSEKVEGGLSLKFDPNSPQFKTKKAQLTREFTRKAQIRFSEKDKQLQIAKRAVKALVSIDEKGGKSFQDKVEEYNELKEKNEKLKAEQRKDTIRAELIEEVEDRMIVTGKEERTGFKLFTLPAEVVKNGVIATGKLTKSEEQLDKEKISTLEAQMNKLDGQIEELEEARNEKAEALKEVEVLIKKTEDQISPIIMFAKNMEKHGVDTAIQQAGLKKDFDQWCMDRAAEKDNIQNLSAVSDEEQERFHVLTAMLDDSKGKAHLNLAIAYCNEVTERNKPRFKLLSNEVKRLGLIRDKRKAKFDKFDEPYQKLIAQFKAKVDEKETIEVKRETLSEKREQGYEKLDEALAELSRKRSYNSKVFAARK
jgi:hypothetical protein